MKYVAQFSILILISCIGEVLRALIPLPIPASIYGMILMFACLCTGAVKLNQVERASDFLLEIMPLVFIPGGVGLMTTWMELKQMLVSAIVIVLATSVLVMTVSGHTTQFLLKRKERKHHVE